MLPEHQNLLSNRVEPFAVGAVSRDKIGHVANAALHAVSREPAADMVAGIATLFAAAAARTGMNPEELFLLGDRMLHSTEPHHIKANVQMDAIQDYAGLALRDKKVIK